MKQLKCKILSNRKICEGHYLMRITTPYIAKLARPGQFIHIRCSEGFSPFLRRPFSIHKVDGSTIDILYQVIGKGTKVLSKRKAGQYLDIIGPLGSGFEIKNSFARDKKNKNFVLVAGGIGVAPLLMLAQQLRRSRKKNNLTALIGAKTKKTVLCKKGFKQLGLKTKIATEDGSLGFRGFVTDLLEKVLRNTHDARRNTQLYVCGPEEMLKKIKELSVKYNLKAQGSLERNMACGVGACLGCVIKTKNGYKRVCRDGPVFNLSEIIW